MRLSAEEQVNWLPRTLGPMSIRPGLAYKAETKSSNPVEVIPFVFASDDTAAIEVSDSIVRVLVDDTPITRASVATAITNGDFGASGSWTLAATSGSSTVTGGYLVLVTTAAGGVARATQSVSVSGGDEDTEHALRIVVTRGPVVFRVGTTSGGDELIGRTELETGEHSLAFTPSAATFYVQFETRGLVQIKVDSIEVEAAGVMELPAPWTEDDLDSLRYAQSADVVFIACVGYQQRRIERRATRSWSIVTYKTSDGPFQSVASIPNVTVTPSATTGNITLTASAALFASTHVGSLFRLFSTSQAISASLAASDTYSEAVRIFGIDAARSFTLTITGVWVGTLTLQRSFDGPDTGFLDTTTTYAANASATIPDDYDNQEIWYRIGFKGGDYSSGTANIAIAYPGGGGAGVVRITDFSSSTSVGGEVLSSIKSLVASSDWQLAEWSDAEGWPSAVALFDGRLWWAGRDKEWGSISDAYHSFDIDEVGDAGPISRSIGAGPVENINWLLPLQRLIVGTAASEISVRSSSFDEPLTPTNFSQKDCSTQGSAARAAVKMDKRGIFIQRSGQRIFELGYSLDEQDYKSRDLTQLRPDIAGSGGTLTALAVQRQPDTRIHAVRSDGQVAVLVYEPDEEVVCWWRVETDGIIEKAYVLPGEVEDAVYYVVQRTIDGQTVRFHERFAREDQCLGQPEARLADSHILYSGAATDTITGLDHLEGEEVVVWGWNTDTPFSVTLPDGTTQTVGKDLGTFTVASGAITGLSEDVTDACVGLAYTARFKSAKLAYGGSFGTALAQKKRLSALGLILADTHAGALSYGQSYAVMDALPLVEDGMTIDTDTIWSNYDRMAMELPGQWDTDARLCLEAAAPRPCTVLAAVPSITTHDK